MRKTLLAAAIISGCAMAGLAQAGGKVHWGYTGEEGPEHWGKLAAEFATCSAGKSQSPVNLSEELAVEAELPKIELAYKAGGHEVINNGHTIQVNYQPGSSMSVAGKSYELKQYHFHAPSENAKDGKPLPLEVHFVHADEDGNLAVLGMFYELGEENAELVSPWAKMPEKAGGKASLDELHDAAAMLPKDLEHFRFSGSLTTPPCTEGVSWFVLKDTASLSEAQLEQFATVVGGANNRPVQPVNARVILH